MSLRAGTCQGKVQAAGEAAERCLARPSQHSQVLSVMQELCSVPTKKVYAVSLPHATHAAANGTPSTEK